MADKITCFKLNWYDRGLSCIKDVLQEEITVYRNQNRMVYKEMNGYGVVCGCEIIHVENGKIQEFFAFIENICDEWDNNYFEEVCDGSEWKIRMWHSSHKVKTVYGTAEYPPHGKEIEKYIRSFLIDGKRILDPKLFGCS